MKRMLGTTLLLSVTLASCGQSPTPLQASKTEGKARILTNWAASNLLSSEENGTLTFDTNKDIPVRDQALDPRKLDDISLLSVNDIIMSAPTSALPYGIMAKVISTSLAADGTLKIDTQPVSLEEGLASANVSDGDYSATSQPTNVQPQFIYNPAVIDSRTQLFQSLTDLRQSPVKAPNLDVYNPPVYTSSLPSISDQSLKPQSTFDIFNKEFCFSKNIIDQNGVNANINGCTKVLSNATLNIKWGFFRINQLEARIDGAVQANGNLTASGNWALSKKVVLASILMPTQVFYIGPVPVVFTPGYDIVLNVNGSISAQANISTSASLSGSLGAIWNRSSGWTGIKTFNSSFTPPQFNKNLNVSANAELQNTLGLYFYGLAGVSAYATPYTSLSYNASAATGSKGSAVLGMRGGVSIDATRFISSAKYSTELFNKVLYTQAF